MRNVFSGLLALAAALSATISGAFAQTTFGKTSFDGADFLESVQKGGVWCLRYRPSDQSCSFVVYAPSLKLVSGEKIVEADGYWLAIDDLGASVKVVQRFYYFNSKQRVCLRGQDVRPEHINYYAPAGLQPWIVRDDKRLSEEREKSLREGLAALWASDELTCWSYRLEELNPESSGPEISMRRSIRDEPLRESSYGVFFEGRDLNTLKLRP